jgi:hypothetical protein
VTCSACGTRSHYARVCVKAGNAVVVTSSRGDSSKSPSQRNNKGRRQPERNHIHNVNADIDEQSNFTATDESDNNNDSNVVYAVQRSETLAVLYAKLNGHKTRMLYNPGAAYSIIGKNVWKNIGAPKLTPTPTLLAFTKVEIKTLGKADITVQAFKVA